MFCDLLHREIFVLQKKFRLFLKTQRVSYSLTVLLQKHTEFLRLLFWLI